MDAYPVDLETEADDEGPVVVLSDGTREPLSEWMRRQLDRRSEGSVLDRVGARIW